MDHLRDPKAIYEMSFKIIEKETALDQYPPSLRPVVVRMIHACGMVDLTNDIAFRGDVMKAGQAALAAGKPILCDCEMVRSGITKRFLPDVELAQCYLNDERTPALAKELGTTRSAAQVELWGDAAEGAIIVIGNAPTTLFKVIEMVEAGHMQPAAIIATPVGFVGAAESKDALTQSRVSVPYITVTGRRGGSAMASAAMNAIALGGQQL
ncbi:precorrin-8X methylmutase [Maritalea mediterranea]|uniref:Precorrin-8X methylmutase n=1 Tax=Maritalea mediterranea TaxID=2909667 RepID=A0ABS9E7M0_9HYPH|nr:precorrin-8X methylmutase [Maritalea mediterranea]MCF4097428.1 precorrin-8X methylmutase [Maritalea mediterranea]